MATPAAIEAVGAYGPTVWTATKSGAVATGRFAKKITVDALLKSIKLYKNGKQSATAIYCLVKIPTY